MTIEEKVREIMLSEALSDSEKLDRLPLLSRWSPSKSTI